MERRTCLLLTLLFFNFCYFASSTSDTSRYKDENNKRVQDDTQRWSSLTSWGKRGGGWSGFSSWGKRMAELPRDGNNGVKLGDVYSALSVNSPSRRSNWAGLTSWGKKKRDWSAFDSWSKRDWKGLDSWAKRRWAGLTSWGKRPAGDSGWRGFSSWGKRADDWNAFTSWGKRNSNGLYNLLVDRQIYQKYVQEIVNFFDKNNDGFLNETEMAKLTQWIRTLNRAEDSNEQRTSDQSANQLKN